ncbi:hypothetical protein [Archangium violaceum]|uniref:Uncharacterized protein n=1 Tax=Archangium violaceum Cb vi76 TaxID=1406225 RepID=A0A084STA4_9BACT|nr:hypothetical protein [Archangium violaceum]KFA91689.1 hypothetical protein Q664_20335 [Archangium violaceum Cb vi76]
MAWKMTFDYDEVHDVVTATFQDCILNNSLDVARWRTEVEGHLSKYPSKVDLLINLDGLVVKYTAGRVFGRERSEVLSRYTLRSFRFGGDEMTKMFVSTSGVINGAAVNVYRSRDEALRALLADRASGGSAPVSGKKAI